MNVLLVTPPFSEEERYGKLSAVGTLYPPLGLAYIAAVAEEAGHRVRVIESEALHYGYEDIYAEAEEFGPDIIGMPTFLNTIRRCFKLAGGFKLKLPKARIVLGGVQATLNTAESMAQRAVDFVIRGEGERAFRDLLAALEGNLSLSGVKGLVWRSGEGEVVYNESQPLIRELDTVPLPARHLFPMQSYHASSQLRRNTLHLFTSRGCPFRCSYCTSHLTFGKTFRYHSSGRVIEEMLLLKEKFKAQGIQFYDETFTLHKERVFELCDELIRRRIRIPWACFTRVNLVDRELLGRMREAGCYQIFYGVEAASQRLLDLIKKDITIEQIQNAFRWTRRAGIEALASFMIGLPTETVEESYATIDLAIEIGADYAQWQKTTPFPGTELFDICRRYGTILTEDWTKFTAWNELVYVTHGRTGEDIMRIERAAFRRFYLRPGYLLSHIAMFLRLPPRQIYAMAQTAFKMAYLKQ